VYRSFINFMPALEIHERWRRGVTLGCLLVIDIQGLNKSFAGRRVLQDISLGISRGETVVLAGPSGAGKSTLLRCMNGLETADTGVVRVVGQELAGEGTDGGRARERQLVSIRRRVGFVFQQWHLFANLTVLANVVEAPVHVHGASRQDATARARLLLDRVGIGHRAAAYPDELSGGEQQRAAIARALAMNPEVLLLDEPTSALDAARVDDLLALLRELRSLDGGDSLSGNLTDTLTIVAASHDIRVPAALGARLVAMESGRIIDLHRRAGAGDPTAANR
jgi:polar amino acid transport system ATP-binding protein